MKIRNISILIVLLVALMQSFMSSAQEGRFYLKADAGGVVADDVSLSGFIGPVQPNSTVTFDPGIRLGIRGGYGFTDWFAGEVETGFTANEIDSISGSAEADGSYSIYPLMINARFNFPNSYRVAPYCGVGAGIATTVLYADDIVINGRELDGYASDTVFVYQVFAGVRISLNERMAISIGYHYMNTDSSDMESDDDDDDSIQFGRSETHAITGGFEWVF